MKLTEIINEPNDLNELDGPYKEETEIIYKDNSIVCLVPKSQMSSKMFGKGTHWCSTSKTGFEMWAKQGLFIRFIFRGGKKIRVTYMFDGTYNWANENGWHTLEGKGNPFNPKIKNTGHSNEQDVYNYIQKIPQECKEKVLNFIVQNEKQFDYCYRKEEFKTKKEIEREATIRQINNMIMSYGEAMKSVYGIKNPQYNISFSAWYNENTVYLFDTAKDKKYATAVKKFDNLKDAKEYVSKILNSFWEFYSKNQKPINVTN